MPELDPAPDPARRYFVPEIETMPREQIDELAEEKLLGDIVPWAYERSPLLRETWDAAGVSAADIDSMEDFREKVPFIDKDAIRAFRDEHDDPYGGLLCIDYDDPKMRKVFTAIFSTSGTTGDPTPAPAAQSRPSFLVREFWELGCRPGDHFMHCLFTFRGPTVHETVRGIGATPVFVDHQPGDVEQLFRFSRELRPTGWYTMSGPLLLMIEQAAAELGVDPAEAFSSYQGVIFAGEPIGPRARARAESWGLELFIQTGLGRRRRGDGVLRARRRALLGGHRVRRVTRARRDRARRRRRARRARVDDAARQDRAARAVPVRRPRPRDARAVCVRAHPRPHVAARPQGRRGRRRREVGAAR